MKSTLLLCPKNTDCSGKAAHIGGSNAYGWCNGRTSWEKKRRPPGTQTLWRGIQRLDTATEMYAILTNQDPPHPLQSGP